MRPFLFALSLFAALQLAPAADLPATDDARVAATLAPDHSPLEDLLSPELRYTHTSGATDSKVSFLDALNSGKLKYTGWEYLERAFSYPSDDIALMYGKVKIHVQIAGAAKEIPASFLAVWRKEKGQWRFLAWQSARLPDPAK